MSGGASAAPAYQRALLNGFARRFASDAKEADQGLLSALQKEIDHEAADGADEGEGAGPPNGFVRAPDSPGNSVLLWQRAVGAEEIRVIASVNDEEVYDDEFDDDEDDEGSDDGGPLASHPFTVEVAKAGTTRVMRFECSTEGEELAVQRVALEDPELGAGDEIERPYDGPQFSTLDPDLQSHLYSFLWSRGVDRDFVGHLFDSVVRKEQAEYVKWLKDVQGFVGRADQ